MKKPLSYDEFVAIYSKVPRLNVELVVTSDDGVLLTRRSIEPYKDTWHLPGGTVWFGNTFEEAVKRIAQEELGVDVTLLDLLGYIEYPSAKDQSEFVGWPMGLAFLVEPSSRDFALNNEASELAFFTQLPENTLEDQKATILNALQTRAAS